MGMKITCVVFFLNKHALPILPLLQRFWTTYSSSPALLFFPGLQSIFHMADIMISQKCNPDSTAYLLSLSHVPQNLQNKIQTPLKMLHTSVLAHSFCLLSCHSLMGALHSSLIKVWHLLFLEQLCLPCCSLLGGYPTSSFPL